MLDFPYPTVVSASSPRDSDDVRRLPQPGELWSLWDLFNFKISQYWNAYKGVEAVANDWIRLPSAAAPSGGNAFVQSALTGNALAGPRGVSEADKETIHSYLAVAAVILEKLEFESSLEQLNAILGKLRPKGPPVDLDDIRSNCRMLLDSMRKGAQRAELYYYPKDKAKKLAKLDDAWGPVFEKFKRAGEEVKAGVDLWALGHSTACVFHMMRAAELGLRVLARERKVKFASKPLEWGTWGNLIDALDTKIIELKRKPNGPAKDRALTFYSGAVGRMRSLNTTRDLVMHVRKDFDEHEAESVMNHVREMMTILAEKLDESSTTAIKWGIK